MTRLAAAALAATLLACASSQETRRAEAPPPREEKPPLEGNALGSEHPFEVEGKIGNVGEGLLGFARSITILRKDAPPARLAIAEGTRITVDDRPGRLGDVREGDEVRATFDFEGGTAVVLELEAERD